MSKKIDFKAIGKAAAKYVAAILVLVLIVVIVVNSCEIRSSKEANTAITGTPLDVSKMSDYEWTYIDTDGDYTNDALDYANYKVVYNSANYQLLYHPKDASIIVRDKNSKGYVENDYSTGYMWTSTVDLSQKPLEKLYELWRRKVSSLFILHVFDANQNRGAIDSSVYLAGDYHVGADYKYGPAKLAINEIEGGFEATFAFESHFIQLSVRIYMKDDILHVEIPQEGIIEQGNYKVSQIDMLPMFGCVQTHKTDGYVFYPDGSGAISVFNEDNVRETETTYKWKIYGETVGERQKIGEVVTRVSYRDILENYEAGVKSVALPVFGIREDDEHAYFAIIDSGSADSIISYDPGGYVVELNRIYTTVTYRRAIDLNEIGGYGITSSKDADAAKFESEMQQKDFSLLYNFLKKGEADYSGMAKTYREYLIKNNQLTDFINDDKLQLGVDLYMGTYEEQSLADRYVSMTTFSEAETILSEIRSSLGDGIPIATALYGWQGGGYGYDPLDASASGKLGGNKGIKALSKLCKDIGVDLALNVNPVDMQEGKFSARIDAAYMGSQLPLYTGLYGYARSYKSMFESYLPSYVKYAKEYDVSLNIEKLGWWLYNNYKSSTKMAREDAYNYIIEQLAAIKDQGVNYWTESNRYTISSAGRITALDYTHSQYDISTEAVPFYQMVIHSYIPYSSIPGNLSHDINWIELKWAEYGYMPYFLLSEKEAAELKYTESSWLYSSQYSQWKDEVLKTASQMSERLSCVWNSEMIHHDRLDNLLEVFATRFANNKVVYVNYTDREYIYITDSGSVVTIPAKDYVVLDYTA